MPPTPDEEPENLAGSDREDAPVEMVSTEAETESAAAKPESRRADGDDKRGDRNLAETQEMPQVEDAGSPDPPAQAKAPATPPPLGPPEPPDQLGPPAPSSHPRPEPAPTAPESPISPASDSPDASPGESPPPPQPRHMRAAAAASAVPRPSLNLGNLREKLQQRLALVAAIVPLAVLVLLIGAWAVDTTGLSGQVVRNVEIAGHSIGGVSEDDLPKELDKVALEVADRKVTITSDGTDYETTTSELGLQIDKEAMTDAALDAGRGDSLLIRPFKWLASFFSPREVPLHYTVSENTTANLLQKLQAGAPVAQPVEPTMQLTESGFALTPGQAGNGIDASEVVDELLEAAEADGGPIEITADKTDVPPVFSDQEVQALVDEANAMTGNGLEVTAAGQAHTLPPEQLRSWISMAQEQSKLELAFDTEAAKTAVPEVFGDLGAPVDATVSIASGTPEVIPGENGIVCCGDDAGTRVWEALKAGQSTVEVEATEKEPEVTTAEAEAWGIKEPVGGSRAWSGGGDAAGPKPGFTTYEVSTGPRRANIHRIADLVDGAVIPPDGTFSINDHVGERTTAKGFVAAGAIRDGHHVDEVGGGVSQFATTTFNSAYFAGLDIESYQAHTEYFSRYPKGREATMGYPAPDLVIHNNTPYGVLIDTSYSGDSLTVTMWSSPYATAEQTGISESPYKLCTSVTTTRTRTYTDGSTETDRFKATYRPEGFSCDGPLPPPPPPDTP